MWAQAPGIQCSQLADVAPLGAGLEKLQALTSFCEIPEVFVKYPRLEKSAEK